MVEIENERGHLWTTRSTFGCCGTTVPLRRWPFFCRWRMMTKSARESCWAHDSSRTSTFFNRIKHRVVKHKGFSTSLSNCTFFLIVCSYLEVIPMLLLRSASWMQIIQLRHCFAALCTTQNLQAAAFFPSRLAAIVEKCWKIIRLIAARCDSQKLPNAPHQGFPKAFHWFPNNTDSSRHGITHIACVDSTPM